MLRSAAGTLVRIDIEAVELGLSRDLIDLTRKGEVTIADVEDKMLGHLFRIYDFTDRQADLVWPCLSGFLFLN